MTEVTLYRYSGRYYTADGKADRILYHSASYTFQEVAAQKYELKLSLIDNASGSLWLCTSTTAGTITSFSRSEDGVQKKYKSNDNAASSITVSFYKVNGSWVDVYGAHPAHPGMSMMSSRATMCVVVEPADKARYRSSGLLFVEGETGSYAPNRQSGTGYVAGKVVYQNDDGRTYYWFGDDANLERKYVAHCGYYYFYAIDSTGVSSVNTNTRTVASGKKRALVADVLDYNSGSNATLATTTSTGSTTFGYRSVLRQGLGGYLPKGSATVLRAAESVATSDGCPVVLRAVSTSSGGGLRIGIGYDLASVLTRRPSLTAYDFRVMLYGEWARRFAVTVDADGGTGGTDKFYFSPDETSFFSDAEMLESIGGISAPAKPNARFVGLFDDTDPAAEAVVDEAGVIRSGWAPTAAATTLTAHWRAVVDITLDAGEGTGGEAGLVYDSQIGGIAHVGGDDLATSLASLPSRECFRFTGYFSAASGGTQYVDASGSILPDLADLAPSSAVTIHAQWERVSWKAAIDLNGGDEYPTVESSGLSLEVGAIFCDGIEAVFYADDQLRNHIDTISMPRRLGHVSTGLHSAATGGDELISSEGTFNLSAFTSGTTLFAQWTERSYTVTFDYGGGSGAIQSKTVTWGQSVGALPVPAAPGTGGNVEFVGWTYGATTITADTIWQIDDDATLEAKWNSSFGETTDYFNLGGDVLMLVESSDGAVRNTVATCGALGSRAGNLAIKEGNSGVGGFARGGTQINPTCRYRVRRGGLVEIMLGKAFGKAVLEGSGTTGDPHRAAKSGYMLVSAEYATEADGEPTLVLRGAANEGYECTTAAKKTAKLTDAINVWTAIIRVSPDHVAQDPFNAVAGGGELLECKTLISCNPVVPLENGMPCASDVVGGKITVSARTCAYFIELPPQANGSFLVTDGSPEECTDTDFKSYTMVAERSL